MQTESKTNWADNLKWLFAVALLLSGVIGDYYYFARQSSIWIRIIAWLIVLATTVGVSLWTRQGALFPEFAQEAWQELRKVTWPSRHETVQTAMIVMAIVVVAGGLLWGIDSFFLWCVGLLAGYGAGHS